MELLANKAASSVLEIALVSIIPLIWWLVTARKKENFFKWIGFKKIEKDNKKAALISTALIFLAFMAVSFFMLYAVKDVETATSEFKGLGAAGLPAALVYAIFNTSLPEEMFFRGFLLKRLANKTGFVAANIIQSLAFGLLHGFLFFSLTGPVMAAAIVVFTGLIAYAMGYVNEKKANGSIIPSWVIHAAANIFSSAMALFSII